MRRLLALATLLVFGVVVAGCGGDDDAAAPDESTAAEAAPEPAPPAPAPPPAPEPAPEPAAPPPPEPAPESAAPDPAPAEPEEPPIELAAELLFATDGESCTYDGPETIPAELYRPIYDNQSDYSGTIVIFRMIDGQAAEPVFAELPEVDEHTIEELESDEPGPADDVFVGDSTWPHVLESAAGSAESEPLQGFGQYPVAVLFDPGEYIYACNIDIVRGERWTEIRGGVIVVE